MQFIKNLFYVILKLLNFYYSYYNELIMKIININENQNVC